ncbi:hypothetical protein GOV12_00145 [Candidatus Pacearchaeota archaeon]|nr:hypothetical protein [Candidatus Pacearchaeota archaeon]
MVEVTIERFNCKLISNSNEASYFIFNKKDYTLMNDLLETASVNQSFGRSLSKIHIPELKVPEYNKNKDIFKLHTAEKNSRLYHINDCTVQVFTDYPCDKNLAGILIVNLNKDKREKALKTLEKFLH